MKSISIVIILGVMLLVVTGCVGSDTTECSLISSFNSFIYLLRSFLYSVFKYLQIIFIIYTHHL